MQRITGDRFYDDDNKVWYVYYDKGKPISFVSVHNNVIKNVWGDKTESLVETLKEINKKEKIQESIVPLVFKEQYKQAGFKLLSNGYKKFIEIRGGSHE
ncbi:MAG TPA: hypothetical protein VLA13_00820 [Massilibacterium sp.]|nr:hypothetical protein [Massilibacterium sp.]